MPRITKRVVDALRPQERERVVWDDEIKGFGVRVHPTGKRVYIVKYRHRGRVVKTTIGPHGPIAPAEARARAAEIITAARTGRDPAAAGGRGSRGPTVAELAQRFLEEYVPAHCKPGTRTVYRSALVNHVVPRLGSRRVADIERADIVALHHALRATPYQANRTVQILSRLFTLAEVWGLRPDGSNPCRHVRRFREEKRERFLSDAEYARLGAALKAGEEERLEPPEVVAAIRLLMLTGCRRAEILTLHWDHVDLEAGELRLPDSKTGAKTVHLGDPAIAVLRAIPRRDGDPFVIAGSAPGRPMKDLHHYWQRIRRRAGLEGVRIHDLRHSYASGGLLVGEGLPMIGKLLGHTNVHMTARYAHLANDPLKSAANRIANRIAAVSG
ncbi:MAG: tyrosine-type recombinase/integrase [Rhodospirillaceae bacterium]|nr:tyrosine-type recombinase/integrase [Rhodospirillaceae bacterium]MDE0619318.1 tyrosine-type recombinase/integrase [Rhodospirillaceae bacterium]